MRKFLSNGVIAALMTIFSTGLSSEGNAMGSKPETNILVYSCVINGLASEVPEFTQAVCPAFTKAIQARWPEMKLRVFNADIGETDTVLEINVNISTIHLANVQYRWAKFEHWKKGDINVSEEHQIFVLDAPLNATFADSSIPSQVNGLNIPN